MFKKIEGERADYRFEPKYASLGLMALDRGPQAFLSAQDRNADPALAWLIRLLPPALTLSETAKALSLVSP